MSRGGLRVLALHCSQSCNWHCGSLGGLTALAADFAFEEDTSTNRAIAIPQDPKPREVTGCKFHRDKRALPEFSFGAFALWR
jgi:hypothetical protein